MRHYLKVIFLFATLPLALHCQVHDNRPSAVTNGWTNVASTGATVLSANSDKFSIKVIIESHEVKKRIDQAWGNELTPVPAACRESSWCSLVDKLEIIVNGKQIRMPPSLISQLAVLNEAKIQMKSGQLILQLLTGDASQASLVVLEFDDKRVSKKSIYSNILGDASMDKTLLIHEEQYPGLPWDYSK